MAKTIWLNAITIALIVFCCYPTVALDKNYLNNENPDKRNLRSRSLNVTQGTGELKFFNGTNNNDNSNSFKLEDSKIPFKSRCLPNCIEFGTCNEELRRCDCPLNRTGADCSVLLSRERLLGRCLKHEMREIDCNDETLPCLNDCNERGVCLSGFCKCLPGYFGADCSLSLLPHAGSIDNEKGALVSGVGRTPRRPTTALLSGSGYVTRSKRPWIYVYELPPHLFTWYNAHRVDRPIRSMFYQRLLGSGARIADGDQADWFFIPVRARSGAQSESIVEALEYVAKTWPWFHRYHGRRHFLFHTADLGRSELSHSALEKFNQGAFKNVTWLTYWGLVGNDSVTGWTEAHQRKKDVVVPVLVSGGHYRSVGMNRSPLHRRAPNHNRLGSKSGTGTGSTPGPAADRSFTAEGGLLKAPPPGVKLAALHESRTNTNASHQGSHAAGGLDRSSPSMDLDPTISPTTHHTIQILQEGYGGLQGSAIAFRNGSSVIRFDPKSVTDTVEAYPDLKGRLDPKNPIVTIDTYNRTFQLYFAGRICGDRQAPSPYPFPTTWVTLEEALVVQKLSSNSSLESARRNGTAPKETTLAGERSKEEETAREQEQERLEAQRLEKEKGKKAAGGQQQPAGEANGQKKRNDGAETASHDQEREDLLRKANEAEIMAPSAPEGDGEHKKAVKKSRSGGTTSPPAAPAPDSEIRSESVPEFEKTGLDSQSDSERSEMASPRPSPPSNDSTPSMGKETSSVGGKVTDGNKAPERSRKLKEVSDTSRKMAIQSQTHTRQQTQYLTTKTKIETATTAAGAGAVKTTVSTSSGVGSSGAAPVKGERAQAPMAEEDKGLGTGNGGIRNGGIGNDGRENEESSHVMTRERTRKEEEKEEEKEKDSIKMMDFEDDDEEAEEDVRDHVKDNVSKDVREGGEKGEENQHKAGLLSSLPFSLPFFPKPRLITGDSKRHGRGKDRRRDSSRSRARRLAEGADGGGGGGKELDVAGGGGGDEGSEEADGSNEKGNDTRPYPCEKFSTGYSGGTRQEVYRLFWDHPGFRLRLNDRDVGRFFAASRFCFAPLGGGHGQRQVLVSYMGCVPVLVSDHVLDPFEPALNWTDFAVKINRSQIQQLPQILDSISEEELGRKQAMLQCYAQHLAYSTIHGGFMGESGRYDAFETTLEYLRMMGTHPDVDPSQYMEIDAQFRAFMLCDDPTIPAYGFGPGFKLAFRSESKSQSDENERKRSLPGDGKVGVSDEKGEREKEEKEEGGKRKKARDGQRNEEGDGQNEEASRRLQPAHPPSPNARWIPDPAPLVCSLSDFDRPSRRCVSYGASRSLFGIPGGAFCSYDEQGRPISSPESASSSPGLAPPPSSANSKRPFSLANCPRPWL